MSLTWSTTTGNVNTEVTATLSFKDNNVRAVYIDWDDGPSNKRDESNYQWLKTTEPVATITGSHTYNATGTFYPIIQTLNSEGFVSRYYSANATETAVTPFSQNTNLTALPVLDLTATSAIKSQNKTISSGIDNSILDRYGPQKLYVSIMPTLTNDEIAHTSPIKIELTLLLDMSLLSGAVTDVDAVDTSGGAERRLWTGEVVLSGTKISSPGNNKLVDVLQYGAHDRSALVSGATVARVLKVKYKNPKYVGSAGKTAYEENEVYNRLKIGFFTAGAYPDFSTTSVVPLCYITPGDPIKLANDSEREVIVDFSQSRAAASNVSMSKYFYDNGKLFYNPAHKWITEAVGTTVTTGGTLSTTATTIPVASTANFPASGTLNFRGAENVKYTNITATSFLNCTRGFGGSTAYTVATDSAVDVGMIWNTTREKQYWQFTSPMQENKQRTINYTYNVNPYGQSNEYKARLWSWSITYKSPWTTTNSALDPFDDYLSGSIVIDQVLLDDFGRLTPQYHFLRLQVEPSSSTSYKSPLNTPNVFRITPAHSWSASEDSGTATTVASRARDWPTVLIDSGSSVAANNSYSKDYSTNNMLNTSGPVSGDVGSVISLSGANSGKWRDMGGTERTTPLQEYLLLLFDEKPDKIFFNMSNYAHQIQSSPSAAPLWGIDSVSTLMVENSGTNIQNVFWEPMEFEDGTAVTREIRNTTTDTYDSKVYSLARSGVISFNPPVGWQPISLENLYGGKFSDTTIAETAGTYDFGVISGSVSGAPTAGSLYGDYVTVEGTASGDITSKLADVTDDDIGSFKYIAIPFSGSQYELVTATDDDFSSAVVATNQITNNATYGSATKIYRVDKVDNTSSDGIWAWGEFTTGTPFAEDEQIYLFNSSNAVIDNTTVVNVYTMESTASGSAFWLSKDGSDGYSSDNDAVYFHLGDSTQHLRNGGQNLSGSMKFLIKRINGYEAVDGFSRVYRPADDEGGSANKLPGVNSFYPATAWDNEYQIGTSSVGDSIKSLWKGQDKYAVKIAISGTAVVDTGTSPINVYPMIWNIFDTKDGTVVKVIDNSAYNLNSVAVTSSISVARTGQYFKAITRKGKVYIAKTGIAMEEVGFSSVALGDENSATAFDSHGPSTLYGHLHTLRKIQAEDVRCYWDEPQKDGTFVRLFGVVKNINEVARPQGPRRVVDYTFTLAIENIAIIDSAGNMITDIFPLGGIQNESSYT